MHLTDLRQRLRELGAAPLHERRVLRNWAMGRAASAGKRAISDFFPQRLREALPALETELAGLARLRSEHPGEDGTRLLLDLADGQMVEAVLLPRDGLCISSQVGCAVGCVFCMTGTGGLQRQLGSAELVAQVAAARTRRAVTKVVFMGMGEPAHNLEAVLEAVQALGTLGGIGHKNLVISTVGDDRLFDALEALPAGSVKPALAVSLHSTDAATRARLLPKAPPISPRRLIERADAWARATGYPGLVQWTLIDGVNDGDDEVEALTALLAGRRLMLNLIPYNHVESLPWKRPDMERAAEMARRLHRAGVLTKLRRSAAQDVDGGCGQLRARVQRTQTVRWVARTPQDDDTPMKADDGAGAPATTSPPTPHPRGEAGPDVAEVTPVRTPHHPE